jgi:tripartite-type tricarboxylate transporter receptor subunit TctC
MNPLFRKLFISTVGATALSLATAAFAQGYPSKPIRWIVPYPAGGGSDFFARTVTEKLSAQLGQTVVIDNRPGAATIVGAQEAARSAADGYTVFQGDSPTYAVNPSLYKKLPYNPQKDFAPVTLSARYAMVLVVNPATLNVASVKDFIELAKKAAKPISFASVGSGTTHHLAMELFMQQSGIQLSHVPYKGSAPAIQDLMGGHVPVMFLDMATALPNLKSGRIKAIGVASGQRLPSLPNVPTIQESGLAGFEAWAWQGLAVPVGTPKDVISKLNAEFGKAAQDRTVRQKLADAGIEPLHGTPEQMAAYIKSETQKWEKVIRKANITVE